MSLISNNSACNSWIDISQIVPSGMTLESRDLACVIAKHLNTASLMRIGSVSRGAYHAYRPQLDARLIVLFNLSVKQNALHHEVMDALRQIPAGETRRTVQQLNAVFAQYSTNILPHLLRELSGTNWDNVRFQISEEIVPFTTREELLRLSMKVWMEHSKSIEPQIHLIGKGPELLRFLLSVARNLPEDCSEKKRLVSTATGALSAFATQENNVGLEAVWTTFKKCWNIMNACEQAEALLILGTSLTERSNHPVEPFMRDFLNDTTLKWADAAMKEAFIYICEAQFQRLKGGFSQFDSIAIENISILLGVMSDPSANNELVIQYIPEMLRTAITTKDPTHISQDATFAERILQAQLQILDPKCIAYMLFNRPDDKAFQVSFVRFKNEWKNLSASEQAKTILVIEKQARHTFQNPQNPAVKLVRAFAENEFYGWKNLSMQSAYAYLIEEAIAGSLHQEDWGKRIIRHMLQVIANPGYEFAYDIVYAQLSNIVKCCTNEKGIEGMMIEWAMTIKLIATKKMAEFSAITIKNGL